MRLTEAQINFIKSHEAEDTSKLALLYSSASKKGMCDLEGEELRFALMQIEARQRLKDKLPTILQKREFLFPTRISTEQASSEVTAALKEETITKTKTGVSADLTGGLGIDTIFMGRNSKRHHYVELNPEHCAAAENNLPLFMNNVVIHNTDAESFIRETEERFDFVYADPARRNESNSKVFMLEDCMPNILDLKPLIMSKSQLLIVKLSPMLDITQAIDKLAPERLIIVSLENECKELIAICGHGECKRCVIEAVEINKRGRWQECLGEADGIGCLYGVPEAGMVMYEPYAAMMKAGHYEELAAIYGMNMVAPSSHLFYGENRDFPGRKFIIKEVREFTKNSIKDIKKANITVRNFPMSVAEVRKRFCITDGGDLYLFLTTDNENVKRIIICEKSR